VSNKDCEKNVFEMNGLSLYWDILFLNVEIVLHRHLENMVADAATSGP
jgi:hypothetical protein